MSNWQNTKTKKSVSERERERDRQTDRQTDSGEGNKTKKFFEFLASR